MVDNDDTRDVNLMRDADDASLEDVERSIADGDKPKDKKAF